jgi:hypothetical protein
LNRDEIFERIKLERQRQDMLHPLSSIKITNSDDIAGLFKTYFLNQEFLTVLGEEYGEVCRALQGEEDSNLKTELIQVASVCVRWLEILE